MLKAIVTVLDESDRIIQANRIIFEDDCTPVAFGTEHEFRFKVVTADDDLLDRLQKGLDIKPPSLDELRASFRKEK